MRLNTPHWLLESSASLPYLYWYGSGLLTGYLNSAVAVNVAYMIPGMTAFLFPFLKNIYNRLVKPLPGWLSASLGGSAARFNSPD